MSAALRTLFAALVLTLALAVCPASAAGPALTDLAWQAGSQQTVCPQTVRGETWLFLPAQADLTALPLTFDGGPLTVTGPAGSVTVSGGTAFDLTALFGAAPADGDWAVTLTRDGQRADLHLMQSANLRTLYLTSADPDKDRAWVEESKDHKAKGTALLVRADGSVVYDGDLKQIKGRGNSTWDYPKKPYQLKLTDKTDLLETGEAPASTWVLLANYCDPTLLHNTLTYALAEGLGLAYTPHSVPVDLYYDGEYRGSYQLSEKTEAGESRVDIGDLEGALEEANPTVEDWDALPTAMGTTANGDRYQYVTGVTAPAEAQGGYLLEMDFAQRATAEKTWFTTGDGRYLVVKAPEYLPQSLAAMICDRWQALEDALVQAAREPEGEKALADHLDLASMARSYLLLELSQDGDAFQSSTFFYLPADGSRFYAGPLWDFDSAYGSGAAVEAEALVAGQTKFGRKLLAVPALRTAIQTAYDDLSPLVAQAAEEWLPAWERELAASQAMDRVLWPEAAATDYPAAVADLTAFLTRRDTWLRQEVRSWTETSVLPAGFADVRPTAWYAAAVDYVAAKGLMEGTSQVHFSPEGTMTRAMAVTVLWRMAGSPAPAEAAGFPDVSAADWYGPAVAWAVAQGMADGYPDGTFRPDQPVTRQELVVLFARWVQSRTGALEAPAIPAHFVDRDRVPAWAQEAFGWAIGTGILTGSDGGALSPQVLATRCQGAALFQRLHQTL